MSPGRALRSPAPRRWAWQLGALGLAAAVSIVFVAGAFRTLSEPAAAQDRRGECLPGTAVPLRDGPHVSQAEAPATAVDPDPPTSGSHFAVAPAPGIYRDTLADGLTVHALEHGHIVIHHRPDIAPAVRARLERIAKRHPDDVLVHPRPTLSAPVVLTAWGRIDRIDGTDEPRVERFVRSLRGRYVHGWSRPDHCR